MVNGIPEIRYSVHLHITILPLQHTIGPSLPATFYLARLPPQEIILTFWGDFHRFLSWFVSPFQETCKSRSLFCQHIRVHFSLQDPLWLDLQRDECVWAMWCVSTHPNIYIQNNNQFAMVYTRSHSIQTHTCGLGHDLEKLQHNLALFRFLGLQCVFS